MMFLRRNFNESLTFVVETAVNQVGVNVNTASSITCYNMLRD